MPCLLFGKMAFGRAYKQAVITICHKWSITRFQYNHYLCIQRQKDRSLLYKKVRSFSEVQLIGCHKWNNFSNNMPFTGVEWPALLLSYLFIYHLSTYTYLSFSHLFTEFDSLLVDCFLYNYVCWLIYLLIASFINLFFYLFIYLYIQLFIHLLKFGLDTFSKIPFWLTQIRSATKKFVDKYRW